jgi:excisionase family DNA binding protein
VEKLYTPEMAAELLHVSPLTLRNWLRGGQLNGVKVGRQWRIRESDLRIFLDPGSESTKNVG